MPLLPPDDESPEVVDLFGEEVPPYDEDPVVPEELLLLLLELELLPLPLPLEP